MWPVSYQGEQAINSSQNLFFILIILKYKFYLTDIYAFIWI
jgi:hypothetical protein